MEKKRVLGSCIFLMLILYLVPAISAIDTKVKVTTYADHEININFLNPPPGPVEVFKVFNLDSGPQGVVEFVFTSNEPEFDITAFSMKDGKKVAYERFNGNIAGESLHIKLFPGNSEIIKDFVNETKEQNITNETSSEEELNETETNETEEVIIEEPETSEEEIEQSPGITGLAASDKGLGIFSGKILYYVIGLLILSALVFAGISRAKTKRENVSSEGKEIKVKKLSQFKEERKKDYKRALEDAERKIEEAQKQIKKIKNSEKIEEMRKRISEEQEELRKLEGGG